jgi:hypothetical protein
VGGVLVEHPGLVHDHPLTPRQSAHLAAGRWHVRPVSGSSVADVRRVHTPSSVPAPPVRVDERRNAGGGYAEFFVRDLRRPQRRRNHPRRPAVVGGDVDGDVRASWSSRSRCALHDHQRIGRGDGSGSDRLPFVESRRSLLRSRRRVFGSRRGVAAVSWSRSAVSAATTPRLVRCATCSGVAVPGGRIGEAIRGRKIGRQGDELPQLAGAARTPCLGGDSGDVLLDSVPRPRRRTGRATIQRPRRDLLHGEVIQRYRGLRGLAFERSGSYPASRSSVTHAASSFSVGGLLRRPLMRPRDRRCSRAVITGPIVSPGCACLPCGFEAFKVAATCSPRFDITALNGSNSATSPVAGSRVSPCRPSTSASSGWRRSQPCRERGSRPAA